MDEKSRSLLILAMILTPVLSVFALRIPLTTAPLPTTLSDAVIEMLSNLKSNIDSLPNEAFGGFKAAAQHRNALSNKVELTIQRVQVGDLPGAIVKLNDLADKINKWVLEPWKTALIEKVAEIIGLLGLYV